VRADCSEAIETIQQAASGAPGKQRVDLRTLLTQALQTVLPHLANADVKLDVCNEMRFPLEVDAFCLVGALVNLLSNAIEASPAGGVVRVTTEQALPGTEALVRIINPGRNYTKQELDDFFTPGRTTKGSRGHLGLGLAISRRAVEASGGSLDLKPPDSGGVEAWITLPLALQGGLPQAVKTNGEIA
jgi:signal transduction histidine kinase